MFGHDDSHDGVKTPIGGLIENTEQETAAELDRTRLNVFAAAGLANSERFEVLSELGRGGMGIVYRARDRETSEVIAIKVLRPEIARDSHIMERFKNELRLARKITHKNVCRIYDLYRTETSVYITMELIEGESLRQILNRGGAMAVEVAIDLVRQICAGLHEARSQGIVHRDLKPENVMLDRFGTIKIMDFGVARSLNTGNTLTGAVLGTPAYMAPEQAEGRRVDHRADIYALGLVMYEMLTGVAAFAADTPVAIALKQIREMPVRPRDLEPSLPPALERTILKCLDKNPERRFQTVNELDSALAVVLPHGEVAKKPRIQSRRSSFLTAGTQELPIIPREFVRLYLALIQVLYLTFYLIALWKLHRLEYVANQVVPSGGWLLVPLIVVAAIVGIAVRLYMLTALVFDYSGIGDDFHRMFVVLLVVDELWALSPLLVAYKIGLGLAIAAAVALAFLPFSQRTLMRMGYKSGA
jgi:serine/threonine protein kinase